MITNNYGKGGIFVNKEFVAKNKAYDFLDSIVIQDMEFVLFKNSSFQYTYLKKVEVHGHFLYLPFDTFLQKYPQYQTTPYQNIKNLMDAFIIMLNKQYSLSTLKSVVSSIIERNAMFFEKGNIHILSLDYFLSFFTNELVPYRKKTVKELLQVDARIEEKERKTSFPFAKFAYMVLVAVSAIMFMELYGVYTNWKEEGSETKKLTESLIAETPITQIVEEKPKEEEPKYEVADDNKTPTGVVKKDKYGKDYWNYMDTPMISVDFSKLKKENPDTVGWLFVNNTNINYPFVQTTNNTYYLDKAFNKTKNAAGWLFADYRSDLTNFKKNTVIYGHGRVDQVMFGSLEKTLEKSWYTNPENQIIKLSTPSKNTLWQIVSIYTVEAEAYYLTHNFENDASYLKFLKTITSRSIYDFGVEVSTDDKILTLSTCLNYNGERIVVHAKLVKSKDR